MSYVAPADLVTRMIDAGEYKVKMSTRDTLVRAYMGGAILTIAAAFAVTVTVQTGSPLVGAMLFPVGVRSPLLASRVGRIELIKIATVA